MTDTVEKTATAAVDLQTKAVELIDQLTAGLKAVAPQMADVTLAAIRMEAVINLLTCAASVALVGVGAFWLCRAYKAIHAMERDHHGDYGPRAFIAFGATSFAGAFLAFILCTAFWGLVNTGTWIAALDPRLALALRVINKLM